MSIKKLENSSDHAMVAEEVKILTNLLNESTRQLSGDVIFNKIQDLLPSNFIRAHKSYIVNINNIANLDPVSNLIYFSDNSTCDIGPKFKKDLLKEVKDNECSK